MDIEKKKKKDTILDLFRSCLETIEYLIIIIKCITWLPPCSATVGSLDYNDPVAAGMLAVGFLEGQTRLKIEIFQWVRDETDLGLTNFFFTFPYLEGKKLKRRTKNIC